MAYNDYGSFVWHNGERRRDKEDSGVFDSDESDLAPAVKIYANIIKLDKDVDKPWLHLKHGVMGDGDVRVSCFKTCFPCIWRWPDGSDEPEAFSYADLVKRFGWTDYKTYEWDENKSPYMPDDYDYEFDLLGWHFHFTRRLSDRPQCHASMERGHDTWECEYGSEYGAGFEEGY